jgi:hypothetical protein
MAGARRCLSDATSGVAPPTGTKLSPRSTPDRRIGAADQVAAAPGGVLAGDCAGHGGAAGGGAAGPAGRPLSVAAVRRLGRRRQRRRRPGAAGAGGHPGDRRPGQPHRRLAGLGGGPDPAGADPPKRVADVRTVDHRRPAPLESAHGINVARPARRKPRLGLAGWGLRRLAESSLASGRLAGPGGGRRDHALVCWPTAFTRVATGTSACLRDGRRQRLMVGIG